MPGQVSANLPTKKGALVQSLVCHRKDIPEGLTYQVFTDRTQQFIHRLNWNLCVTSKGLEVDEYDDEASEYLIVHDGNSHFGSCRVRPTSESTMLREHFGLEFPDAIEFIKLQKGRVYELTRFCRNPYISVACSREMIRQLALLLDQYRDQKMISGFLSVVFPHVARFLDSVGVRYIVISKSKVQSRDVLLICITHAQEVYGFGVHCGASLGLGGKAPEAAA